MATTAMPVLEPEGRIRRDWWRWGDGAVLLAYSATVLWTLQYHEKWADEAQAWLIARDLDLGSIWFHELRYEGSPGLWHTILWVAQHVFHARYEALGYIGAAFAIAGTAVLLFWAPFPRYIRWPLAFTYVLLYQYAVIARPYTLLPLLAFCGAIFFKDVKKPERMTIILGLLALLTLHGAILAGCLGVAYLLEAAKEWSNLGPEVRKRYWICGAILAATFVFVLVILKPTPDVEEFAVKKELALLPKIIQGQQPTWSMKLESVLSGAFLDYTTASVAFVLLVGAWCALRRKLVVYALPLATLVGLYVAVHGYAHHHGTVTIAAITAVWIAWPGRDERNGLPVEQRRAFVGVCACLVTFCAVNIWDSVAAIKHEYLYPYSGAGDAAQFLKSRQAEKQPIFGLLYGVVGIQAYFDHNIFANLHTSFFHHGLPLEGIELDMDEVLRVKPEYIVAFTEQPQLMMDSGVLSGLGPAGYKIVHFSDGYLLYKGGVYVRQAYFILARTASGDQVEPTREHSMRGSTK